MTIICGIDFSTPSLQAAHVAALMAKRVNLPLRIVYAHDGAATAMVGASPGEQSTDEIGRCLTSEVERLRNVGADVSGVVGEGLADEVLARRGEVDKALMIVVAAHGHHGWLADNVALRTAQTATVPVLVVRDPGALETSTPPTFARWLSGSSPLRVVVGIAFKHQVQPILDWLIRLREIRPCDVCFVHAASLHHEAVKSGKLDTVNALDLPKNLHDSILKQLRLKIPSLAGPGIIEHRVSIGFENLDHQLAEMARVEHADLLVIGTRPRSHLAQTFLGTMASSMLHLTTASVACIPLVRPVDVGPSPVPRYRRVLAAVDADSPNGHVAAFAVALVETGGIVHFVHVRRELQSEYFGHDYYIGRLRALVPHEATTKHISTLFVILDGQRASDVICSEAERLEVDAVLIGSHTSSVFGIKAIGSVTHGVLVTCGRPVIVVHEPKS